MIELRYTERNNITQLLCKLCFSRTVNQLHSSSQQNFNEKSIDTFVDVTVASRDCLESRERTRVVLSVTVLRCEYQQAKKYLQKE